MSVPPLRVGFLGDIVGSTGRRAAVHAAGVLRAEHGADFVIANAENARHGSGLTPDMARSLLAGGIDALTLGDHWARARVITEMLDDPTAPIARPANLSDAAPGARVTRAGDVGDSGAGLWVVTVLGRLFMKVLANDPFECLDREIGALAQRDARAMVIVEVHAEATSEKLALLWHAVERWTHDNGPHVVAVVGTHTHVPTADERVVAPGVAAITDLGMTGPKHSILGRKIEDALAFSRTQMARTLEVAPGDTQAQGAVIELDLETRRAVSIERVVIDAQDASASA